MAFWKEALCASNQMFYIENIWVVLGVCMWSTSDSSRSELSWEVAWDVVVGYDSSVVMGNNSYEVLP